MFALTIEKSPPVPIIHLKDGYRLIGYKRGLNDISTCGLYRSVIINENNQVVCFSPPKSTLVNLQSETFEEFVEGTMINIFWCPEKQEWIPCTRRNIGANVKFYMHQTKTFAEMFNEVITQLNIEFDSLSKSCSYSFVMQHPENRIVNRVLSYKLVLIDIFEMVGNNRVKQWQHPLHTAVNIKNISFPTIYNYTKQLTHFVSKQPATFMGVVIRCGTERMKIRNPQFEKLRQLLGNQADLLFRYIELKKEKKIKHFLRVFPEHTERFANYKLQIENLVKYLFLIYSRKVFLPNDFYIRKTIFRMNSYRVDCSTSSIYLYLFNLPDKVFYKILRCVVLTDY